MNDQSRKVLFIDRDGTLIHEPEDERIDSLEKLEYIPGVFQVLSAVGRAGRFEMVMVTNQDGLGTDVFPDSAFQPAHDKLMKALEGEDIRFSAIHIDRSYEHEGLDTRKPGIGMLRGYLDGSVDLGNSFVIGDRVTDIILAKNLGSKAIIIRSRMTPKEFPADLLPHLALVADDWKSVGPFLLSQGRIAEVTRKTNETDIHVALNLQGQGVASVSTGIGFFDHMLEQLARHGGLDLTVTAKGDLHIDEHHTIEDTALALGEAFSVAIGDKRGLARYGFCLPMDDCLAQVAVDFGGRPWLEWNVEFNREKIGEMPTEMFMHFFKSFSDSARCNLNIRAEGQIEHHKIEAIFKAFARAIRMAVKVDGTELPSTKGML
ncbi:MAG: bifunctional histidinol-phosphatase/imidazoleglycerol-phosphate dehydratase HisB [Bacteroidota bacterium]